jgi:hypothetical protein
MQWGKESRAPWTGWSDRFESLSIRKRLAALFLTTLVLTNTGSLFMIHRGISFSGDEPHYLLITHSVLHEGDFDLADNYKNRDYSATMPPEVTLKAHAVPGAKPGSQYSFHSPGISLLLVPFYALGSLFGKSFLIFFLRLGMSLIGALLGVQIYLFARQEWGNERLALLLWFLAGFTTPIYFYSIHVYPELVITLFSFIVFRFFHFSDSLSPKKILLAGLLLSFFIWFHALKYIFISIPLLLYCLWILFKNRRRGRDYAFFILFPVVVTALYFFFQKTLYGSSSLSTVSWKGSLGARESLTYVKWLITGIPFRYRWETLANYFFDQKDGLLLYAPIYFFSFLGMIEMLKRKGRDLITVLFLTVPYVLVSAFLTQRTGYAPQARPVVSVIWAMGIFLGYFLVYNRKKIFSHLFSGAEFISLLFVFLLLRNPFNLYQETTFGSIERGGGLFYLLSNLNFQLPRFLPSYIKIEDGLWLPNFIWLGLLLIFIGFYLVPKEPAWKVKFSLAPVLSFVGLLIYFVWIVLYPRLNLQNPVRVTFPQGEKITFYQLSRVARMSEPGRFLLPEDNRAYIFTFTSPWELKRIEFELGSIQGDYSFDLTLFDRSVLSGSTTKEMKKFALDSPPRYRMKDLYLYLLKFTLRRTSQVSTAANPYLFAIRPVDP